MPDNKILDKLHERFERDCPTVLDDDQPDAFDDWLAKQDLTEEELDAIN
jgi:hypothetical protein